MEYRFINEHHSLHAISLMCSLLRVARAGFYAWLHDPISTHEQEGRRLLELIRSHTRPAMGSMALAVCLRICERPVSAAASIMRKNKIKAVRGYKAPRHIAAGLQSLLQPLAAAVHDGCARHSLGH